MSEIGFKRNFPWMCGCDDGAPYKENRGIAEIKQGEVA
jgi:hypothetical protein